MTSVAHNERRRTAKRGNGEGSIYYWEARRKWAAAFTKSDGKRKVITGGTRAEVANKLSAALKQRNDNIPFTPERLTVGQYLTDWLESSARLKVRASTYNTYLMYMNRHIIPGLGTHRLARLTPNDVQKFIADRASTGLKPRTVQQIHAILRRALGQAYKQGLVARNVASSQLVDAPRVPYADITPLDQTAVLKLLDASRGHRYEHLYCLLLTTGLRLGEALALRWQDCNLEEGWISINGTIQRAPGHAWQRTEPKSKSGVRNVKLVTPAITALRAQRARSIDAHLSVFPPDFVFQTVTGKPCHGVNVYNELQKLLARAGLPRARVHDLRHGAATYLLAAGVAPRTVMAIMGWSQISMLTRYQHVLDPMLVEAAQRLENHLGTFLPRSAATS